MVGSHELIVLALVVVVMMANVNGDAKSDDQVTKDSSSSEDQVSVISCQYFGMVVKYSLYRCVCVCVCVCLSVLLPVFLLRVNLFPRGQRRTSVSQCACALRTGLVAHVWSVVGCRQGDSCNRN